MRRLHSADNARMAMATTLSNDAHRTTSQKARRNRPIKVAAKAAGLLRATPHLLAFAVARRIVGQDKAFRGASERIALCPGTLGVYARQWFYRLTLREVGKDVYFGWMSVFSKRDVRIGDGVYIGRFCTLGLVDLDPGALLSDGVQVLSGRHQHGRTGDQRDELQYQRVRIGQGSWIGAQAVVMADIGDRAIVGAGAVVTKAVESAAVVGGIPARTLRQPVTRHAA